MAALEVSFEEDSALTTLLEKHGLGSFANWFAENQVDLAAFVLLKDEDLMNLQIPLGPRLKMKRLIETKGISSVSDNSEASSFSTSLGIIPNHDLEFFEDIGRGSFGAVFRGSWKGNAVAIKQLLSPAQEEAKLLSHLRHRNIVRCFGCVLDSPTFCLVFEYAQCNLAQALQKFEVDPTVVVEWALQIATGMNYLHTEAPVIIIHRDLKPANILLFIQEKPSRKHSQYILKITDFGLSRIQDESVQAKFSTVGTWEYMAPEVIRNEPYSEKADIYSYGVVLWEMLTKQQPYRGIPSLAVAFGVGTGSMSLPIPSNCPATFARLLEKCWSRTDSERLSFREIMRIMETISQSEFMNVSYGEFLEMRALWSSELGSTFDEFKKDTDMLKKREMVLSLAEMRLTEREHKIQERELQLQHSLSADLMCWYTLRRFTDDILGLGLSVTRGGPGARNPLQVTKVDVCHEYLSYTAYFVDKVRHSISRDMELHYWIPLYICPNHGTRAQQLIEDAILAIITGSTQKDKPSLKSPVKFEPRMAVAVLSTLMNNMVVNIVREAVHPFKALEMYCAFHRLLLDFIQRYPDVLLSSCRNKVKGFIQSEDKRSSEKVYNLGEFLVLLSIVDVPWESLVDLFVIEMLERSWFWILRYHPDFQDMSVDNEKNIVTFKKFTNDDNIVENAFDGARRSLRIVMLHCHLLRKVARPNNCSRDQIISQYDTLFGQATAKIKDDFENACKEIFAISTFQEFFQFIGYVHSPFTTTELSVFLRRTAANSLRKHYHGAHPRAADRGYVMIA